MNIISEAQRFKEWANQFPVHGRYGEWETEYENWGPVYSCIEKWIESPDWSQEAIEALLYLLARDNEVMNIRYQLGDHPEIAIELAKRSLKSKESCAKWQIVECIGNLEHPEIDQLLYQLYFDRDYYVQRRCMMESAKRKSLFTREMIELSWSTHDEYQMICVLWSLHWLKAPDLPDFLSVAKNSEYDLLKKNVEEISNQTSLTTPDAARPTS
ncbi:hypothetical protein IEN85_10740 [Pelagicoccus sp. NFK12]|uniref:HEAT repeat domain-containing protein n=1 Tax=Pelagicoccus enzymogenes TaxID=2773457 RepID=A0A927F8R2_9BACT|nr:hypothetical protein [Pelagicoccus enzymogenes]MBD5779965.1 hypothetical protein [Pelagicoccus enzymogenes]